MHEEGGPERMGCITGLNLVKTFASLHEKLNNIEHKLSVERISRESSPLTKVILRVHYKNYHSGQLDYLFQTRPEFRALIIKPRAGLKNSFIIIITIHIDGEKTRKEEVFENVFSFLQGKANN